jgi:hypothetical protein
MAHKIRFTAAPYKTKQTPEKEPLAEPPIPLDRRGYRSWSSQADDHIISYARKVIDSSGIRSRKGLSVHDPSLYCTLRTRGLLDRVGFSADRKPLISYSNDELLEHARRLIDENGIRNMYGLDCKARRLSALLREKGLIDQINFEKPKQVQRSWDMDPDELVSHAQKLIEINSIGDRQGLMLNDHGLYKAIKRRNLLAQLQFPPDERKWSRYDNDSLVEFAVKFVGENGLTKISDLQKLDKSLYSALWERDLVECIDFKEKKKEQKSWSKISNPDLLTHAQSFVNENGIRNKRGLSETNYPLYRALMRRKLLDALNFEKKRGRWSSMSNEAILSFAADFIAENKINCRSELLEKNSALYRALEKRKLLNTIFPAAKKPGRTMSENELYDQLARAIDAYTTHES